MDQQPVAPTVAVGLGTKIGYGLAFLAAIAPMVGELADDLEPLGVPNTVWVLVSAALAALTTLGRMYQAGQAAGGASGGMVITEPVPQAGGAGEPDVTVPPAG